MSGRTRWFPKDAAWWRRDRVVELGQTHGPAGPAVMDWLTCEAKAQGPVRRGGGNVKTGYSAVAYGTFLKDARTAKAIIATCVEVGLLDDFAESGRTFTCRISGWHQDVEQPLEAARRAMDRARDNGGQQETLEGMSPDVQNSGPTRTLQGQKNYNCTVENGKRPATAASVALIWEAHLWSLLQSSGKASTRVLDEKRRRAIVAALEGKRGPFPVEDLVDAAKGWRHVPHNRGENDRARAFNDVTLIFRDAEHIEQFRDAERGSGQRWSSTIPKAFE